MNAGRDDDVLHGINVTPLVDVMLVLLVVLMVTGSYALTRALELDLPRAGSAESVSSPLELGIDAEGRWLMGASVIDAAGLRARLRSPDSPEVSAAIVAADGRVAHREVTRLLDVLAGEGVTRVGFSVRPPAAE